MTTREGNRSFESRGLEDAHPYPRIVPYTHTTAFLFAATAERREGHTGRQVPLTQAGAPTVGFMDAARPLPPQASWSERQLAYLADPAPLSQGRSGAHGHGEWTAATRDKSRRTGDDGRANRQRHQDENEHPSHGNHRSAYMSGEQRLKGRRTGGSEAYSRQVPESRAKDSFADFHALRVLQELQGSMPESFAKHEDKKRSHGYAKYERATRRDSLRCAVHDGHFAHQHASVRDHPSGAFHSGVEHIDSPVPLPSRAAKASQQGTAKVDEAAQWPAPEPVARQRSMLSATASAAHDGVVDADPSMKTAPTAHTRAADGPRATRDDGSMLKAAVISEVTCAPRTHAGCQTAAAPTVTVRSHITAHHPKRVDAEVAARSLESVAAFPRQEKSAKNASVCSLRDGSTSHAQASSGVYRAHVPAPIFTISSSPRREHAVHPSTPPAAPSASPLDAYTEPLVDLSAFEQTVVSALSPLSHDNSPLQPSVLRRPDSVQLAPRDVVLSVSSPPPSATPAATPAAAVPAASPSQGHGQSSPSLSDADLITPCVVTETPPEPQTPQRGHSSGLMRPAPRVVDGTPSMPATRVETASASPALRGRLTYGTAEKALRVTEVSPSPSLIGQPSGRATFSHVASPPPRTPRPALSEPEPQSMKAMSPVVVVGVCRLTETTASLLSQEEAAAREWLQVAASVHMHHLACEERVSYRTAEAAQYRRRLNAATALPSSLTAPPVQLTEADLITPPAQLQRGTGARQPVMEARGALPSTTPLSLPARVHKRMPAAPSLPPLSPRRGAAARGEAAAAEPDDALSPITVDSASPSPPSLSPSLERPVQERQLPRTASASPGRREAPLTPPIDRGEDRTVEKEGEGRLGGLGNHVDRITSSDDEEWEEAEESDGDAALETEAAPATQVSPPLPAMDVGDAQAAEAAVSLSPRFANASNTSTRTDSVEKESASVPTPHLSSLTASQQRLFLEIENDEEDARYLLTGDCPPPDVFERWTARYLSEQRRAAAVAEEEEAEEERVERKDAESHEFHVRYPDTCGGSARQSPEVARPLTSPQHCSEGEAGSVGSTVPSSVVLDGDSPSPQDSPEAFLITVSAAAAAATAPLSGRTRGAASPSLSLASTRTAGRSYSRQRLCSERNRARMMEGILDESDSAERQASVESVVSSSGDAAAPHHERKNGWAARCSATGRDAPVPVFFDADYTLPLAGGDGGCMLLLSSPATDDSGDAAASLNSSAHSSGGNRGPSLMNTTALPERGDGQAGAGVTVSPGVAPLSYPSEETYEAPFGSERDAWQALMDEFIEGLVRLISIEL